MSYSVTASFKQEEAKLSSTTPVELYVINMSFTSWEPLFYINWNHDTYGWYMNSAGVLDGTEQLYTGLPIARTSVKSDIQGEVPQIDISIPNVDRTMEALIQSSSYLRGRDIYLMTTFAKFLPSGATSSYIGSTPDRFAVLKEKMYIDTTSSDKNVVTFSCKPKFSVKNAVIPRRRFGRECAFEFKSSECGYVGAVSSCDKSLDACKDLSNSSRFGGFFVPRQGLFVR